MALRAFVLGLSIFALVHGYTPTFRNEATHPLKAPTESTLGLQMNDETATLTKTNLPVKHHQETVFSGGKHFEYMLLNDSNVLLTSLQNDGPFDTVAAQFASSKLKAPRKIDQANATTTTDSTKSVQIEATPSPRNASAQNESNVTIRIISKTNFKIEPLVKTSGSRSENGSVAQQGQVDGKLRHPKRENNIEGNFAGFASPLKTTKFLVDPLVEAKATKSDSVKQWHDFDDDSFTKLLISSGIVKPENNSKSDKLPTVGENSSPSIDDINRIMDGNVASSARANNNSDPTNGASSRSSFSQTVGATLEALTKSRGTVTKNNNSDSATEDLKLDAVTTSAVSSTATSIGERPTTMVTSTATKNFPTTLDQFTTSSRTPKIRKNYRKGDVPVESVAEQLSTPPSKSEDPNESPKNTKSDEFFSPFRQDPTFQRIRKKNVDNELPHILLELKKLITVMVQELFTTVTNYVDKLPSRADVENATTNNGMRFERFVLFQSKMAVRYGKPKLTGYRYGTNMMWPPQPQYELCSFPWTNLRDNRTIYVKEIVNDLFDDESADFFWFGLPLNKNAPYELLVTRDGFLKLLETDFAVRIYLQYGSRKIEAVLALPYNLIQEIAHSYTTDYFRVVSVNENVNVKPKSNYVHEFLGSNVTYFYYRDVQHLLELGTSKLIPPQVLAKRLPSYVTRHEDIETIINVTLGSMCTFCILSLMLYGVYRLLQTHRPIQLLRYFRDKYRFLERPASECKHNESSLNVIFSENFDHKYHGNVSWLDNGNARQTGSILTLCENVQQQEVPVSEKPRICSSRDREEGESTAAVNSPRLNKENKLPMLGYRSYCILLPHTRPYGEDDLEKRCFENPNYGQETR